MRFPNLDLKFKITITKVIFYFNFFAYVLSIFVIPIARVKYEESFIIKVEYYADFSMFKLDGFGESQLHMKDSSDFQEALDISDEKFDEMLGKVSINDFKVEEDRDNYSSTSSETMLPIYLLGALCGVYMIINNIYLKKKEKKYSSLLENTTDLSTLSSKDLKYYVAKNFGVPMMTLRGIFTIPLSCAMLYGVLWFIRIRPYEFIEGIKIIPSPYLFLAAGIHLVLDIILCILANDITLEIKEKNILDINKNKSVVSPSEGTDNASA